MGQTTSQIAGSKTYEPQTPVDLSPELRSELESTPETDIVRRLYADKYIEDRVAERLYEERKAAEALLKDRETKVPEMDEARLVEAGGVDTKALRKQVAELHHELTNRPLRGSLDNEGQVAREKLVQCFTENKDRPLNCRAAFEDFHKEVTRIEQKIASLK